MNKDKESLVVQGVSTRSRHFNDQYKPLEFAHFSDIHNKLELWNRIIKYINQYSKYIKFGLHTGDMVETYQTDYTNLYANGITSKVPILNCVGNHDTYTNGSYTRNTDKSVAHSLLFNHTDNWDVTWMPGDYSMTYYKDFPENNIRLIVLDYYYDLDT